MDREELIVEIMCIIIKNPDGHKSMEAIADFIIKDRKRICKPLVKAVEESDKIGSNESTAPAWQRLDKAVYETLRLACIGENNE